MVGRENLIRSTGHCREPGLTAWGLGKATQAVRHRWVYEVGPEAQTTPHPGWRELWLAGKLMLLGFCEGEEVVDSGREPPGYQGTKWGEGLAVSPDHTRCP